MQNSAHGRTRMLTLDDARALQAQRDLLDDKNAKFASSSRVGAARCLACQRLSAAALVALSMFMLMGDGILLQHSREGARGAGKRRSDRLHDAGGASALRGVSAAAVAPDFSIVASPFTSDNTPSEPLVDWATLVADGSSCAAFFGNGFSQTLDIEPPVAGELSAPLSCSRNPATDAFMCRARDLVMWGDRVTMSRGGEPLAAVMGRAEDDELPVRMADGALQLMRGLPMGAEAAAQVAATALAANAAGRMPSGEGYAGALAAAAANHRFTAIALRALRVIDVSADDAASALRSPATETTVIVDEPVILLTRVEYANLFHTTTDWFNAWQTAKLAGIEGTTAYAAAALRGLTPEAAAMEEAEPRAAGGWRLPAHVVFVDGHNAGPMDAGWRALFLSVNYARHFARPFVFRRAFFAPFGYRSAISFGINGAQAHSCAASAPVRQFGNDFVRSLGLPSRPSAACAAAAADGSEPPQALFVRRTHYLAHPRHDGKVVRRLDNEDAIYAHLEAAAAASAGGVGAFVLRNGLFSEQSLREQVALVQDACVIVGAHGAGLSHVLFAPPGAHVLELRPPAFARPHFIAYAAWAGAKHHDWTLHDSTPPPAEVEKRLRSVLAEAAGSAPL